MCVNPVSMVSFRAGKIELNAIHKSDLSNYDSIKMLARQRFCDLLIEKKEMNKFNSDYIVYQILARRKWIKPDYVFALEATTVHKNTPLEDVSEIIYQASKKAANATKDITLELARKFIGK